MTLNIVARPALHVIGMHIETKPMSPEIPALWPKFVARIEEIEGQLEAKVSYGVMWHGESMDILHYLAATSVANATRIPQGMTALTLPAGSYAAFKYPLARLAKGFGEIFSRLLPSSGHVQAAGPYFERYDEAFDPGDSNSQVEICLPVRSRS